MGRTIFLFLLISVYVRAQIEPAARQIATGNSTLARADDVFAIFANPAGLAQLSWSELGIYYSPAPFGLKELSNGYFAVNYNFDFLSSAIGAKIYGYDLYRETSLYLALAKRFFHEFFVGITFSYKSVSIENYGNAGATVLDAGILYYLTRNLSFAFVAKNLFRGSYSGEENEIPSSVSFGVCYFPLDNASANFAVTQELDASPNFKAGIEYGIFRYIDLRLGIETEPKVYSAGLGVNYKFFEIDYAALVHQTLPLSHQIEIIVAFENIEQRREKIERFLSIK